MIQKQPFTTCETASNAYTFGKTRYYHDNCPDGGRIDYVLFRANPNTVKVACKESSRAFGKIPGQADLSYSDHEGVATTFEIMDAGLYIVTCMIRGMSQMSQILFLRYWQRKRSNSFVLYCFQY